MTHRRAQRGRAAAPRIELIPIGRYLNLDLEVPRIEIVDEQRVDAVDA